MPVCIYLSTIKNQKKKSHFSDVQLFAILRTTARQAPLSMRLYGQEYWSGLPCPSPGDLLNPGIEPVSLQFPKMEVSSLPLTPPGKLKHKGFNNLRHTLRYTLCTKRRMWLFTKLTDM